MSAHDGHLAAKTIQEAIETGEGQTFWMKSIGTNEKGEQVSEMDFEWSVRIKIKLNLILSSIKKASFI